MGKMTQLGMRVVAYFTQDDFPSASNVKYGHALAISLQHAPHRRHSPLRFKELSVTYFLLKTYRKKRRMTPDHNDSLCVIDVFETFSTAKPLLNDSELPNQCYRILRSNVKRKRASRLGFGTRRAGGPCQGR